jgi:iron complex outermembrane receptor protein
LLLVGLALAGASAVAGDDEGDDREPSLEERVVVTAPALGEEDVAAFATTIVLDDVARRGRDLADVLRRVPGTRIQDYGGLGSYATVSVRASTSEQVTVLVDGMPQNRALGGPVDISSIPATQVERIQVYRGFAPAGFGLAGIGGVVDVRTLAPDDDSGVALDLLAGELNSKRASANASLRTDPRGMLRIGFEGLVSDGDFLYLDSKETPFNPTDDELRRRENNELEQTSLLLQHVREQSGAGEFRVGVRVQRRERGVPGIGSARSTSAGLDEELEDLNASWGRAGAGAVDRWEVLVDGFRQQIRFFDPDDDIGSLAQDQTTRMYGGGGAGLMRASRGRQHFLIRADLRLERADVRDALQPNPDRGGADRRIVSVTAEDLIALGRVSVAPSLRWEYLKNEFRAGGPGSPAPPEPRTSQGNPSGKVGVAFQWTESLRLRGSVGHFFRNPSLLELFGDRGAVVGNPALRPESGEAVEIGLSGDRREGAVRWSFQTVGFGRRTRDLIQIEQKTQGVAGPVNLADAEVYGVELAASFGWSWGLTLDASATLQHTEQTSGPLAGNPLPYQPAQAGFAGAALRRGIVDVRWEITYVGENSVARFDPPEVRLAERVLHDAALSFDLPRGVRLGVDVANVFDRRVRDLSRHPLPSRVVLVHVGWKTEKRGT